MMTVQSPSGGGTDAGLFEEIVGILRQVTTESAEWAAAITPNARLEVDLGMESIELLELAEFMRARYGRQADLSVFVAGLDIDQIIAFSVGDLIDFVAGSRAGSTAGAAGPAPAGAPAGAPASAPARVPASPGPAAREPVMPSVQSVMPGQHEGAGA